MKNLIQAAVVTLFAASTAQAQQAVRWKVSVGGNGHWYQVMSNPAGVQHWTFAGAKSFAESRGGHLAMFENLAESAALHALLQVSAVSPSSAVWVGLYQDRTASDYSEPAGGWRWVDGRQLHFNPWLPWEPSNACGWQPNAPQDWGAWTGGSAGSGQLDDMGDPFPNCDNVVWFCAIEWSADCNDDGIIDYGQCRDGSLPDYNGNNVPDCCESGTPCVVGRYPIQWRTQDGGNGHWYKVDRFGGQLSWASASLRAQDAGGHLACLSSAHENSFVFSLIASDPSAWNNKNGPWIGARREGGMWSWVNGEAWRFTNWCGGTGTVEHRGQYWACSGTTPSNYWNDHFGDVGPVSGPLMPVAAIIEWSADCNNDGIVDFGQILTGQFQDVNRNGIPDRVCECLGDLDSDGAITGADLGQVLAVWGVASPGTAADLNADGSVDGFDLAYVLAGWGVCAN